MQMNGSSDMTLGASSCWGELGILHYPKNWIVPLMSPTVLLKYCWFCNFHAVFGYFVHTVLTISRPYWETWLWW